MTSNSSPTNGHAHEVTCSGCHEVQASDNVRCARCGDSFETTAQRKARRTEIELARRAAERESVAIQRLPGFGTNAKEGANFGTRQYFTEMSNHRRRRYVVAFCVFAVLLAILYGH